MQTTFLLYFALFWKITYNTHYYIPDTQQGLNYFVWDSIELILSNLFIGY